jgi:hypothetical protein
MTTQLLHHMIIEDHLRAIEARRVRRRRRFR